MSNMCRKKGGGKITEEKNWAYYHQQVFDDMKMFISEEIINKEKSFSFSYFCKYFLELLQAILEENEKIIVCSFRNKHFQVILLQTSHEIKIVKNKKILVTLKEYVIDAEKCEILERAEILQRTILISLITVLNIKKNN